MIKSAAGGERVADGDGPVPATLLAWKICGFAIGNNQHIAGALSPPSLINCRSAVLPVISAVMRGIAGCFTHHQHIGAGHRAVMPAATLS